MRRTLLVLAVTASLFSPGLLDSIGNFLNFLWEGSDAGCEWDPLGSCRPAPEPQPNAGCELDPLGCPQGS